jgi:hypothetical protein
VVALVLFATAALAATTASPKKSGVSLEATGFEWMGYSPEEKRAFAALLDISLGVKKGTHKPEDVIGKLDDYYHSAFERAKKDPLNVDVDDYLAVKCVKVITEK